MGTRRAGFSMYRLPGGVQLRASQTSLSELWKGESIVAIGSFLHCNVTFRFNLLLLKLMGSECVEDTLTSQNGCLKAWSESRGTHRIVLDGEDWYDVRHGRPFITPDGNRFPLCPIIPFSV